MPQIYALYGNRIILIDSSIKFGQSGEFLIYENELFYRGQMDGQRILLQSDKENKQSKSMFEYLNTVLGEKIRLQLATDFDSLVANKAEEDYFDAKLTLFESDEKLGRYDVRVRTRGNMRKKICALPPLKIDFNKKDLRGEGYSSLDKIKLVLPCLESPDKHDYLYRELMVYELYRIVDSMALETKMINIEIVDTGRDTVLNYPGFLVEDEENYLARTKSAIIDRGVIRSQGLDRENYLKLAFFQYMMGNNDWAVSGRHNLMTVKRPDMERMVAVAYDFDYAGIVNQEYNVPESSFSRMDMPQKKLRLSEMSPEELEMIMDFYNERKDIFFEKVKEASWLDDESRRRFLIHIREFYRVLNSRKQRGLFFPPIID